MCARESVGGSTWWGDDGLPTSKHADESSGRAYAGPAVATVLNHGQVVSLFAPHMSSAVAMSALHASPTLKGGRGTCSTLFQTLQREIEGARVMQAQCLVLCCVVFLNLFVVCL